MIALLRTTALLGSLSLLTACGMGESKHASNGTPQNWWSDNYIAMLQDANGSNPTATPSAKPIRLKLQ